MSIPDDMAEHLDAIDDLPRVPRPMLTFVALQTQCVAAAHAGLACVHSNQHERANGQVRKVADRIRPTESDQSPNAWARRGAADGIVAAWEGREWSEPSVGQRDLDLYNAAWSLANFVTLRIRQQGGYRD